MNLLPLGCGSPLLRIDDHRGDIEIAKLPRDGSLCLLCRHECHRGLLYWPVILRNLPHLGRTQGAGPGGTSVTFVFVNVGLGGTEEEPGGTSVRGNGTLFGQLQSELKRGAGCRDRPRKGAGPLHQARAQRGFGRRLADHYYMPERVSDPTRQWSSVEGLEYDYDISNGDIVQDRVRCWPSAP